MRELLAMLIMAAVLAGGFLTGRDIGYREGLSADVTNKYGDKWDCAYSDATGFLMCDRTPKYKD